MIETQPNLQLSDRDFAAYLRSLNNPILIIPMAQEWFKNTGNSISEGLDTVTVVLNTAKTLEFQTQPAENANYNLDQGTFAQYLKGLNSPEQRVSTGLEWFSRNSIGYGNALDLTTTIFNNLPKN